MITSNITVKLEAKLMALVKRLCELRPSNEWSGTIFYKVKDVEDGKLEIAVKDFALMDFEGSEVLTKFTNNDNYAIAYKRKQGFPLLGAHQGLLHSHHHMLTCGPSGTDDDTMKKEGVAPDNDNFLSIIVYNSLKDFSVRITQRRTTKVLAGDSTVREFGEDKAEPATLKFKDYESLDILDIGKEDGGVVIYEEPRELTEAEEATLQERIASLKEEAKKRAAAVKPVYSSSSTTYYPKWNASYTGGKKDKKSEKKQHQKYKDSVYYNDPYACWDDYDWESYYSDDSNFRGGYGYNYYGGSTTSSTKDRKLTAEDLAVKILTLSLLGKRRYNYNAVEDAYNQLDSLADEVFSNTDEYQLAIDDIIDIFDRKYIKTAAWGDYCKMLNEAIDLIAVVHDKKKSSVFGEELVKYLKSEYFRVS